MPVRRRFRKKTRKYKSSRRKYTPRRTRKYVRPDGYHTEKIVYDLRLQTSAGVAQIGISWLRTSDAWQQNANPANSVPWVAHAGSNNPDKQFLQCSGMYKEYLIKGFKIEYRPIALFVGSVDYAITRLHCGTEMNSSGNIQASTGDMQGALDYKVYDPTKPFKRYYHVKKWAAQKDVNWRSTGKALTNAYSGYPDCTTQVRMETAGIPDDNLAGRVTVTYYVDFRSRTLAF